MKNTNWLLALLLGLTVDAGASGSRLPLLDFDGGAAPVAAGAQGGASPLFQRTDFRVESVPGAPAAGQVPEAVLRRLALIASGSDPRPRSAQELPDAQMESLVFAVSMLARHTPALTAAQWDQRLRAFSRQYTILFPPNRAATPAQWTAGMDRLCRTLYTFADDPYTQYFSREDFANMLARYSNSDVISVGADVLAFDDGLFVLRALPGSPAAAAGLRRADVITHIDGTPLAGMAMQTSVGMLFGADGSVIRVRLDSGRELTMTRRPVSRPHSFGRVLPGTDVGYVRFNAFDTGIAAELVGGSVSGPERRRGGLFERLQSQGARRFVIDLRDNHGGNVADARLIASEFLRRGDIINYMHGDDNDRAVTSVDGRFANVPLAVLTDGLSASASEILVAALQGWHRALIVGEQTYGKGVFQSVYTGPNGIGVSVTAGGWNTPSDRNVSGRFDPAEGGVVPGSGGLRPDLVVPVPSEQRAVVNLGLEDQLLGTGPAAADDPVLQAALGAVSRWPSRSGRGAAQP